MKPALAAALLLLAAPPVLAKEVSGVVLPDSATVEGKLLKLNGAGVRTKLVFKVYVAGLYVESPSKDPAQLIAADTAKRVEMRMMRDLERGKIVEAIQDGFEKNAAAQLPALKDRLARFTKMIPDLKEGQALTLTYLPGKGTSATVKGGSETFVEGKDFADALFSVWLGKDPVDAGLKRGMLGT